MSAFWHFSRVARCQHILYRLARPHILAVMPPPPNSVHPLARSLSDVKTICLVMHACAQGSVRRLGTFGWKFRVLSNSFWKTKRLTPKFWLHQPKSLPSWVFQLVNLTSGVTYYGITQCMANPKQKRKWTTAHGNQTAASTPQSGCASSMEN